MKLSDEINKWLDHADDVFLYNSDLSMKQIIQKLKTNNKKLINIVSKMVSTSCSCKRCLFHQSMNLTASKTIKKLVQEGKG